MKRTAAVALLVLRPGRSSRAGAVRPARRSEKPKLPESYKTWLEEEVVYIIAPMEREVFLKLQTDRERDLFIEAFWKQRDPTPGDAGERVQDRALPPHRLRQPLSRPRRARARLEDRPRPHLHHPGRTEGHPEVRGQVLDLRRRGLVLPGQDGPRPAGRRSTSSSSGKTAAASTGSTARSATGPRPCWRAISAARITWRPTRSSGRSSPSLAAVSLSLVPGEARAVYGRPSMSLRPPPPAHRIGRGPQRRDQVRPEVPPVQGPRRGRIHGQLPRQRQPDQGLPRPVGPLFRPLRRRAAAAVGQPVREQVLHDPQGQRPGDDGRRPPRPPVRQDRLPEPDRGADERGQPVAVRLPGPLPPPRRRLQLVGPDQERGLEGIHVRRAGAAHSPGRDGRPDDPASARLPGRPPGARRRAG